MRLVMIECPVMGAAVSTGIETEPFVPQIAKKSPPICVCRRADKTTNGRSVPPGFPARHVRSDDISR
jgi:hypothetical protein